MICIAGSVRFTFVFVGQHKAAGGMVTSDAEGATCSVWIILIRLEDVERRRHGVRDIIQATKTSVKLSWGQRTSSLKVSNNSKNERP